MAMFILALSTFLIAGLMPPIHTRTYGPCSPFSIRPCCDDGSRPLNIRCGDGIARCPGNYVCKSGLTGSFCCPLRSSCTAFSSRPCCKRGNFLPGVHCGRGGTRCPKNYECNTHAADRWAVCCPKPKPVPEACTPFSTRPCCKKGNFLPGIHCGRGGTRCPGNYQCNTHAADRWAVCCPIPKPVPEVCTPFSSRPCCKKGNFLPGIHCGRGGTRCPGNYECNIHAADRWAVCCPVSRPGGSSCTPFNAKPCCKKGNFLPGFHCGLGGSRCPSGYQCNAHPADAWAVCCPRSVPINIGYI